MNIWFEWWYHIYPLPKFIYHDDEKKTKTVNGSDQNSKRCLCFRWRPMNERFMNANTSILSCWYFFFLVLIRTNFDVLLAHIDGIATILITIDSKWYIVFIQSISVTVELYIYIDDWK